MFFAMLRVCYRCNSPEKTVTAILIKLLAYTGNGSWIMLVNSPGGSTLQWGAGRGSLCFASLVAFRMASRFVSSKRCGLHFKKMQRWQLDSVLILDMYVKTWKRFSRSECGSHHL